MPVNMWAFPAHSTKTIELYGKSFQYRSEGVKLESVFIEVQGGGFINSMTGRVLTLIAAIDIECILKQLNICKSMKLSSINCIFLCFTTDHSITPGNISIKTSTIADRHIKKNLNLCLP